MQGDKETAGICSCNFWCDQEFNLELVQFSREDDKDTSASEALDGDKRNKTPLITENEDNE